MKLIKPNLFRIVYPNQIMNRSFEEYFYDTYLLALFREFHLSIPERKCYIHSIHASQPKCMKHAKLLYYQGCQESNLFTGTNQSLDFYNRCNDLSRESLTTYIQQSELKLSNYINPKECIILKCPKKCKYEVITKMGTKMHIHFRWKEVNSLSYPVIQMQECL